MSVSLDSVTLQDDITKDLVFYVAEGFPTTHSLIIVLLSDLNCGPLKHTELSGRLK